MLASRERPTIRVGKGNRPTKTVEERVAIWMRDLDLIHDFPLRAIAENRKESHSEHLLRRLQRRIAEEELKPEQAALYFCTIDRQGASQLQPLQIDPYGNITNWPRDFFGDEFGKIAAMQEAALKRQLSR
ncbi:MAG: DUF3696 domain-containing protein [Roseiflexaceae bacterium]|nr:DUF3696 domain-containing protein [Roseiflexus sp.]MDW8232981.1 DUF3696 domain-containing protein [Roseiflexaceae bacterium]